MKLNPANNRRLNTGILAASGGLLGAFFFFCIYGAAVVNPTYDDWIWKSGSDITQHYIGWLFYRRSEWSFPLCLTDGLVAGGPVSCMFTDSIPLFAVFFKILSPLLPGTFQYMGIWGLFCFTAQGVLSVLLLHKFSKSPLFCLTGSIFYIVCPAVLQRMFMHTSLAGHWVILWALLLWAYQDHSWKHKSSPIILWSLNGAAAVLTHTYFIPMIYMIMLGYAITDIMKNKKLLRPVLCIVSATVFSLLIMFCIGAFYGDGSMEANGLGTYSANLNSLFNGMDTSKFLKPMNTIAGQGEGYGYLGLGMIIAVVLAVCAALLRLDRTDGSLISSIRLSLKLRRAELTALAAVLFVCLFFAVSPVCTLNARVLYAIDYPEPIYSVLSIFRASGRFIWVADYLIFTVALGIIAKSDKKRAALLAVTFCAAVQLLDLRDYAMSKRRVFAHKTEYSSPLKDNVWDELAEESSEIIFVPLEKNYYEKMDMYFVFAEYAYENSMKLGSFYLARSSYEGMRDYANHQLALLKKGKASPGIIFIFTDEKAVPVQRNVSVYRADGYTAAVSVPAK